MDVMSDEDDEMDEILGRTRCARCGEVLNADIECPYCNDLPEGRPVRRIPKWVFLTACLLTSPLSLPFLYKSRRLTRLEKLIAGSGMVLWVVVAWWV
jgi:hypothetical protein